jgi:hypothetical protein
LKADIVSLRFLLTGEDDDPFIGNCLTIASRMQDGIFNQLSIATDGSRCVEATMEQSERLEMLRDVFANSPKTTKFIAFSHAKVNWANELVRRTVFGRQGALSTGDIVHIHNSFFVIDEGGMDRPVYVPNDSFAEVVAVDDTIKPLVQPLKGRDKPIVVPLLRVRARLPQEAKEVEFLCLKNYLYAEKPELDTETLLVLRISAESRYREHRRGVKEEAAFSGGSDNRETGEAHEPDSSEFPAAFLRTDPFLNAARLRFGYALTLHRAQGQRFSTVIANLDTGQGQNSEAYFRWLYTLFTAPQNRLILFNVPTITPFSKAEWDDSRARLDSIRSRDLIAFDPATEESTDVSLPFPIEETPLRNLYHYVLEALGPLDIRVVSLEHNAYQEVYGFEGRGSASCSLRLLYNRRFRVTRIEVVVSQPTGFADQVSQALTANVRFGTKFQKILFELLEAKLKRNNMSITGIEHHAYQEVYYIQSETGDVKLQVHYDGDRFVTRFAPVGYSDRKAVEALRSALEM